MSGYSPILELGDDPLTPREKVRQIVDGALNSAIPEPWEVANHATDAILTALASGSGDHAKLARLAEEAGGHDWVFFGNDAPSRFIAAATPATVLAILAENAALTELYELTGRQCDGWKTRATEAERKLAEAVAVIRDVDRAARQAASMNDAGYAVTVERTATHIYGITDAFLFSKEAERG